MARPKLLGDQLLEVTRRIVEAEARAAPFLAEIEALKKRFGELVLASQGEQKATQLPLPGHAPETLGARVVEFLAKSPGQVFTADAIAKAIGLGEEKLPTMRSTLLRLTERQVIYRPYRGGYQAMPEEDPTK
jgi:hypothetical protein